MIGHQAIGVDLDQMCIRDRVAGNATQYNFLSHRDVEDLKEKAKNCDANNSCDELEKEARERSLANHKRLLECPSVGSCAEIRAEIDAGSLAINSFESQLPDGAASKILRSYTFIGGDNLNDWTCLLYTSRCV